MVLQIRIFLLISSNKACKDKQFDIDSAETAGPVAAMALMYGYVRLIRKEKLFDYTVMNLKKEDSVK